MRLLIAEDDLSLGQSIKKGLEEQHYAVDLVVDGQEVLIMSQLISYDLVILDVMLPHIDGFEVCKRLRKRGQTSLSMMRQENSLH